MKLYSFQQEALDMTKDKKRVLYAYEMGLG